MQKISAESEAEPKLSDQFFAQILDVIFSFDLSGEGFIAKQLEQVRVMADSRHLRVKVKV